MDFGRFGNILTFEDFKYLDTTVKREYLQIINKKVILFVPHPYDDYSIGKCYTIKTFKFKDFNNEKLDLIFLYNLGESGDITKLNKRCYKVFIEDF